jgi:hypothetical protein
MLPEVCFKMRYLESNLAKSCRIRRAFPRSLRLVETTEEVKEGAFKAEVLDYQIRDCSQSEPATLQVFYCCAVPNISSHRSLPHLSLLGLVAAYIPDGVCEVGLTAAWCVAITQAWLGRKLVVMGRVPAIANTLQLDLSIRI